MAGGPARINVWPPQPWRADVRTADQQLHPRGRPTGGPLADVAVRRHRESAISEPLDIAVASPFQGFAAPERHDYSAPGTSDFSSGGGGDFGGGGASGDF